MPAVYVEPGDPNSTHDLSLEGGGEIFGISLLEKWGSLQAIPDKSENILFDTQGKKFGDWEPKHSHVQQTDWSGGRGLKNHSDDKSRFFDSQNLITWIPGKILPSYQWYIAEGAHRDADQSLPGNVNWVALLSSNLYIAEVFSAGASYDAEACYMWVRRIGNPGTLTLELCSVTSGEPDTTLQTATVDIDTITDFISVWHQFDISTESLVSGTSYAIKAYGAATDGNNNHWEIGVNKATNTALSSSDGSTWSEYPGYTLYYRVEDAGTDNKYHMFFLDETDLYFISQPSTGDSLIFKWNETNDDIDAVSPGGDALSSSVKNVEVSNNIAHCSRGTSGTPETIWTFDPATTAGQDDATAGNNADYVLAAVHKEDGPQIWRAENDNRYISRANTEAFNTDLTFGDDIKLPNDVDVLSMIEYNGTIIVRTRTKVYYIINDKVEPLPVGLDSVIETNDFMPLLVKDLFLYVAWSHSLEKYLAGQQAVMDDIGPWKDEGLPEGRRGHISCLEAGIGGIFAGIDAGSSGTSSVLFHNGRGWHEVWRAPRAGQRVYNVKWQAVSGAKPRLFISAGADIYYLEFPQDAINPLQDSSVNYMHEAVLISPTIDMDAAAIPKAFRTITAWCENLVTGIDVTCEYQVDRDVGTTDWLEAGTYYQAGEQEADVNEGNRRRIRYRLRLRTNDSDVPPIVEAVVLEGFGRVPWKPQYSLQLKAGSYQVTWQGVPDHDPNDLLDFLTDASLNAELFHMKCVWPYANDKWVVIQPASVYPDFVDRNNGKWQGLLRLVLSEE